MPTGVLIRYPTGLPGPTAAPLTPTERRLASEVPGPVQYRGVQRDFHARQRVQFVLTADQARRWQDWWRVDLLRGGLWFAADWPLLYGKTDNVYRFAGPPSWEFIAGGPRGQGMRRVSAVFEVRGRGELPREFLLSAAFDMAQPINGGAKMQMSFSPVIPKDNTKVLVLEPRIHWARR